MHLHRKRLISTTLHSRTAVSSNTSLAARINRVVHAELCEPRKQLSSRAQLLTSTRDADGIRFSDTTAEAVVRSGLKASVLGKLSEATGIVVERLFEFVGLDRTTVARRVARDDALPQEASVKAMQFIDLIATATDVFGTVESASAWLTKPHPMLEDETPMQRARTPWGLQLVRTMLGALKYGSAA